GGKGGTGKTTISCAYGIKCAAAGLETLVVSTDPAHSVTDVFNQAFKNEPRPVESVARLDAMQIDPDEEVQRHLDNIRTDLSEQVSSAMVNEINTQLEMAHQTPGAYESALFDRFVEVIQTQDSYDRVVFDTAPTGSTLRLLGLPEFLEEWVDRLARKRRKSIDLFEKAAVGDRTPRRLIDGDPVLERLQQRKEFFAFAGETLRNEAALFLVFNPDQLSVNETRRTVEKLADHELTVRGLVANKLTPEPGPDESGRGEQYLRDRVDTERDRLAEVRRRLAPPVVAEIVTRPSEITGDLLDEVASELDIETVVTPPAQG
ncbi:MAG: arsenite efflux ATP-binding protein ArsA, partial [uncultured archaeon A07HR60]